MIDQTVTNINRNLKLLQDYQLKLTTGLDINRPSDDPAGISRVLKLRDSIEVGEQHRKNVTEGKAKLSATVNALSNVEDLVLRIHGLAADAVYSLNSSSRSAIASEINGLLEEVYLNANARYLGKYIFGGHETLEKPYEAAFDSSGNIVSVSRNRVVSGGVEIRGIDDRIMHKAADGLELQVNISGSLPFMPNGEGGALDVFAAVIRVRDNLEAGDIDDVADDLDTLADIRNHVLTQHSILGERSRRFDAVESGNDRLDVDNRESLSEVLDVDYTEAITNLNYQQFVLRSSLEVGARIIPPSLLDFI
jgi:flagellar hook-associated protein 3 FlgL